ncbi:MAG: hypothetical protein IKE91_06330 [Clostridia bacterium]|nr:hypothetical protein [Clostridia bacterium]
MITKKRKREALQRIAKKHGYTGPFTGFSQCARCGECCLKNACCCIPEDFDDLSVKGIEKLLDSGKYMITAFYEQAQMPGNIPIEVTPVISAREVNCPDDGINICMLHSACAMLDCDGCTLSEDERPSQGLMLIPVSEDGCRCYISAPSIDWQEYKDILDEVVKRRTGKTSQEIFEEELVPLATEIKRQIEEAVCFMGSVSYYVHKTAKAMRTLGVFYGLFGEEIGDVMQDFIDWVDVDPIQ